MLVALVNTSVNLTLLSLLVVYRQLLVVHCVVCYVVQWELLVVLTSLHCIRLFLIVSLDQSLLQVSPCGVVVVYSFLGFELFPLASLQIVFDVYDPWEYFLVLFFPHHHLWNENGISFVHVALVSEDLVVFLLTVIVRICVLHLVMVVEVVAYLHHQDQKILVNHHVTVIDLDDRLDRPLGILID